MSIHLVVQRFDAAIGSIVRQERRRGRAGRHRLLSQHAIKGSYSGQTRTARKGLPSTATVLIASSASWLTHPYRRRHCPSVCESPSGCESPSVCVFTVTGSQVQLIYSAHIIVIMTVIPYAALSGRAHTRLLGARRSKIATSEQAGKAVAARPSGDI